MNCSWSFDEEKIFAIKEVEVDDSIGLRRIEFLQYHESKDIKRKKNESKDFIIV